MILWPYCGSVRPTVLLCALWMPAAGLALQDTKGDRGDWKILFDGTSVEQWRGYRSQTFPVEGWVMEDRTLRHVAGKGGGDIITRSQFRSFELELEWKVAPGANSGIMYRVSEEGESTWQSGPEMQILDDARHPDGSSPLTSAGSLYALYAPSRKVVRPAGEWNQVRLVIRGNHVEHWLNGSNIVTYELDSPALKARIAMSKFAALPRFAKESAGHIALQDHGDDVWFRNIRIRVLD